MVSHANYRLQQLSHSISYPGHDGSQINTKCVSWPGLSETNFTDAIAVLAPRRLLHNRLMGQRGASLRLGIIPALLCSSTSAFVPLRLVVLTEQDAQDARAKCHLKAYAGPVGGSD